MSDTPTVPPMVTQLLHDMAQKALTSAAAGMVAKGLLDSDQSRAFVEDGTGLILVGLSVVWTVLANLLRQQKFRDLLNASPQKP